MKRLIQGAPRACFPPARVPVPSRGRDFPRAGVAARRRLPVGLSAVDALEEQMLAVGQVRIRCSVPVFSFPGLYQIRALWGVTVAF